LDYDRKTKEILEKDYNYDKLKEEKDFLESTCKE